MGDVSGDIDVVKTGTSLEQSPTERCDAIGVVGKGHRIDLRVSKCPCTEVLDTLWEFSMARDVCICKCIITNTGQTVRQHQLLLKRQVVESIVADGLEPVWQIDRSVISAFERVITDRGDT